LGDILAPILEDFSSSNIPTLSNLKILQENHTNYYRLEVDKNLLNDLLP
jgi:hypothetical protein